MESAISIGERLDGPDLAHGLLLDVVARSWQPVRPTDTPKMETNTTASGTAQGHMRKARLEWLEELDVAYDAIKRCSLRFAYRHCISIRARKKHLPAFIVKVLGVEITKKVPMGK